MDGIQSYVKVILPLKLEWEPCYRVDCEVFPGDRVYVVFAGRRYAGVVSETAVTPETALSKIRPIEGIGQGLPSISEEEIRLWRMIASYYLCTVGEVFKAAYPSEKFVEEEVGKRQEERLKARLAAWKSKLEKARTESTRERYAAKIRELEAESAAYAAPSFARPVILTEDQTAALQGIESIFSEGKTALLRGVTGSGKTQIYLTLSQKVLSEGKSVLYLVPEIALSRQLEDRIRAVFPQVMIFHSSIPPSRKRDVAACCRKGGPCIVLGTRSALFLPFRNLGLVVVDEEHDTSYKQDSPAPRYNGRDVAIMLARIHGAPVLLGSATPSLESLYNAQAGRYGLVTLDRMYYEGERPEVQIIDTRAERRKNGMVGSFSRKLLEEMNRILSEKGQILVLRTRRSYAPAVQCPDCGTVVKCPCCNVPMSLHAAGQGERLVCHYCGHSEAFTGRCPHCGGPLQPMGAGTQRIEEELRDLFPEASIARLDSDVVSDAAVIRDFAEGKTDILVGTQMIAKGFDFDRLSLVAVVHADGLLARQDFRADERALQLLQQFRGRSGRRGEQGRLILQTSEPDHPVIRALSGEEAGVTDKLLEERKSFSYPPYTRMILLIVRDPDPERLASMSAALAYVLQSVPVQVMGPYAPSIDRIAGQHIRHVRLLLKRDKLLIINKEKIRKIVSDFEREHRYSGHIVVDVDPI